MKVRCEFNKKELELIMEALDNLVIDTPLKPENQKKVEEIIELNKTIYLFLDCKNKIKEEK